MLSIFDASLSDGIRCESVKAVLCSLSYVDVRYAAESCWEADKEAGSVALFCLVRGSALMHGIA